MQTWKVDVPSKTAALLEESLDQGPMLSEEDIEQLRALGVNVTPGMRNLTEYLIKTVNQFKVEIYSNEHPPPHFHVSYNGEANSFRIDNGEPLYDKGLKRYWKNIRDWHSDNKSTLIKVWNETRPSNCPVGEI